MSSMGIASDMNNPNFQGATNPDSLLRARFYKRVMQDNFQTAKEGRPIFHEIDYVEIMTPGNILNIVDTPVRSEHKVRFPREWMIYQNSQSHDQVQGTPVEEWPILSRSQAEEFKAVKFFTVEQVAGASDEQLQKLGMGAFMYRDKARAFLSAAKDSAFAQNQVDEIKKRDQQINELTNTVTRMASQLEQLMNQKPTEPPVMEKPKRKYTRKEVRSSEGPDA